MKYELNCSHNDGGVVYVLKTELSRPATQYIELHMNVKSMELIRIRQFYFSDLWAENEPSLGPTYLDI